MRETCLFLSVIKIVMRTPWNGRIHEH